MSYLSDSVNTDLLLNDAMKKSGVVSLSMVGLSRIEPLHHCLLKVTAKSLIVHFDPESKAAATQTLSVELCFASLHREVRSSPVLPASNRNRDPYRCVVGKAYSLRVAVHL